MLIQEVIQICLGKLFKLSPSEVPIYSIPSNRPLLAKGWGYLSLSHCSDAILISWSSKGWCERELIEKFLSRKF